jgi:HK97 gp10 family phage protein
MPLVSAEIVNLSEFADKLEELSQAARMTALKEAVQAGGFILEGEIKIHIEKQNLVDTGNLLNSIQQKEIRVQDTTAEVEVGTDVVYAAIHEFGGVTGRNYATTIPARPYMRPAVDEGKQRIIEAVGEVLKRNIEAVK